MDSPRWCALCHKYGDHHTDKHVGFVFTDELKQRMYATYVQYMEERDRDKMTYSEWLSHFGFKGD